MEAHEFDRAVLSVLRQVIRLLAHTTPEGRPHIVASTEGLEAYLGELEKGLGEPAGRTTPRSETGTTSHRATAEESTDDKDQASARGRRRVE